MLRRDAQLAARERHLHAAAHAVAVGVGRPAFGGAGTPAMANGDFALVQIFDAEE